MPVASSIVALPTRSGSNQEAKSVATELTSNLETKPSTVILTQVSGFKTRSGTQIT